MHMILKPHKVVTHATDADDDHHPKIKESLWDYVTSSSSLILFDLSEGQNVLLFHKICVDGVDPHLLQEKEREEM